FGDTIMLPSQACDCEQITRDEGSGTRLRYHHKLVAVRKSNQRQGLGTRLRYHGKLVAVSTLKQRRGSGTRLRYHGKLAAVSKLLETRLGDTITLPWQAGGCDYMLQIFGKLLFS
ncbi:unnamed protein product, partial [Symbiodinium sp. CCMP2592]